MADYFTNFSLVLNLKESEQRYALDLAAKAEAHRFSDDPAPASFPTDLIEVLEDWQFETETVDDGLWLHSENGGIDAVCAFIQHLLQQFDPNGRVTFQWSYDCTKPRTDAFGGGAAVVTAFNIETMTTSEWLQSVAA